MTAWPWNGNALATLLYLSSTLMIVLRGAGTAESLMGAGRNLQVNAFYRRVR